MKLVFVALVAAALAGCGGGGTKPGGLCTKSSDCTTDYCFNGECGGERCNSTADCDPAAVCTNFGDSSFTPYCYRPCSSGCPSQERCTSTGYCGP